MMLKTSSVEYHQNYRKNVYMRNSDFRLNISAFDSRPVIGEYYENTNVI